MLYVPEAQGSLPRGATHCTYAVRVPTSAVPYVPRTVVPPRRRGSDEPRRLMLHGQGRASARLSSPEAEAAPAMLQLRKTNLSDLEQQGKEATEPKGLGAETTAASAPRLRQLDRAA